MKIVRFPLILAGVGLAFVFGFGYGRWCSARPGATPAAVKNERKALYYVDAMHPWYKSDKPGIAPDCGMKLVPVYADGTQSAASSDRGPEKGRILHYRDPKDPSFPSEKPGLTPRTGNDLEPVYAETQPANT